MADIAHWFGNDVTPSPSGDLLLIDGLNRGRQRIYRRLLTNSNDDGLEADYIWHADYGCGCPRRVGETRDINAINAAVRTQIMKEAAVAKNPLPAITVNPIQDGVYVSVEYTDEETGKQAILSFNINE